LRLLDMGFSHSLPLLFAKGYSCYPLAKWKHNLHYSIICFLQIYGDKSATNFVDFCICESNNHRLYSWRTSHKIRSYSTRKKMILWFLSTLTLHANNSIAVYKVYYCKPNTSQTKYRFRNSWVKSISYSNTVAVSVNLLCRTLGDQKITV